MFIVEYWRNLDIWTRSRSTSLKKVSMDRSRIRLSIGLPL